MTPALDGFLVSLPRDELAPIRGWPDAETVGDSAVWFRGYLAEPATLRSELGLGRSASFGRIVAEGWQRWRADVTDRIVGEYAAVIVRERDAVLVGDRMALRPLYYWDGPVGVAVSTDLGTLARETGAWRDPDEDYVADVLSGAMHLGPRTPYRDIRRLQVGEYASCQAGRLRVEGGWRPAEEPVDGTSSEHQEILRATVERAVAGSQPAVGTRAVELSGGLDTTTVLAVSAGLAPVHALSFVHPGSPGSDETVWIREALATTPAQWHSIDATEYGAFSAGPEFGTFLPAPSRRVLNWASNAAEEDVAHRLGASTLLTGEGGDAVFFAGLLPWYLADLLRRGRGRPVRDESLRWSTHSELKRSSAFWVRRAAIDGLRRWRSGRTLTLAPPRPLAVSAPWLHRDYVDAHRLRDRAETTTTIRAQSVHGQAVLENVLRCAEFARSRHVLPSRVESRHPLLTPTLVDLAMATPWQVATDPRIDRAVQRYAFAGLVSDTVLRRRSKTIADEAILHSFERHAQWREYLGAAPQIVERGYVDAAAWSSALRAVGRVGGVAQLYSAIQVEVWLRHLRHAGVPTMLQI